MSERIPPPNEDQRQFRRYADRRRVRGVGANAFEGETRDISGGGAAVYVPHVDSPFANDQFVDLHIEGLGHTRGRVVRALPDDGYALEFEGDAHEKARIAAELAKFHENVRNGYA